jgi:hypothetical protein
MRNLESLLSFRSIESDGEPMPFGSEMRSYEVVYFQKSLDLTGGFETPHAALALAGRLRGIFRSVI